MAWVSTGLDADSARLIEANRRNWDARTPIHVASRFYRRAAAGWFADFEWADLGELAGRELVHLQCHLGTETIAFAQRGATVTGLDISGESVAAARRIAAEAGLAVEYVQANVYDAVRTLGAGRFDVVYTGKGAVCYLPDLDAWAAEVAGLLRPGGVAYLVEFHPLLYSLGPTPPTDGSMDLVLRNDFLGGRGAIERDATFTYTDGPALTEATVAYEWMHGVGELVTALLGAGLRLDRLRESERLPWPRWPSMIDAGGGWFRLPDSEPRIPLILALRAVKPGVS